MRSNNLPKFVDTTNESCKTKKNTPCESKVVQPFWLTRAAMYTPDELFVLGILTSLSMWISDLEITKKKFEQQQIQQVRLVSAKAERPNHPSRGG